MSHANPNGPIAFSLLIALPQLFQHLVTHPVLLRELFCGSKHTVDLVSRRRTQKKIERLLSYLADHVLEPKTRRIMNELALWLNNRAEHGEARAA